MNIKSTFEIINAIYNRHPFLDENNQITVIPNDLDCLINAILLYEQLLYTNPNQVSDDVQISFLEKTQDFLLSIPIDYFKEQISFLERTSKEIILRTLDKIFYRNLNKELLSEYCKLFCS